MSNRLAEATSPYLLQHAENPVDWWEWGPEALAEARRRGVPILLSVGYAACHWCHVMAHESFEHEGTAALMNAHFVNIKVDREERPDIDAVYMAATQAMTGQGGWPMTCFLTPEGEPFHCGTYYPPAPRPGIPSFTQLLLAVAEAWEERPDDLREGAKQIVGHLAEQSGPLKEAAVDADALAEAVTKLAQEADPVHGGFGGAPKFPPSMVLEFLLRHHERTGSAQAYALAESAAEAMARGGIHDQLGGGFARYSVDAEWIVPHFEKMLYDNALLLRVYAHLARRGSASARRVAEGIVRFLEHDLLTPQGGFAASLDADTEGVEGLTYVWTPAQLNEVLGEDGPWAAELFSVTEEGTFEEGASTLQLRADPDDFARFERVRQALLEARAARPQPGRDDKVVAAWNGLAISALAEAGVALERPQWIELARNAASLLLDLHLVDGRLRRSSRDGAVGAPVGVLEDYACLADGLLALHQATGEPRWLTEATRLLDVALTHFASDSAPGAYHDTADDAEVLVQRPSDPTDNASPSGASALAGALLTASALAGSDQAARYRDAAELALRRVGLLAARVPRFAGHWLSVAEAAQSGPVQVAVVGGERAQLVTAAAQHIHGGGIVLGGEPDAPGVPLLADRPLVGGEAAAYVCRGYVCERPVTAADQLIAQL
ncbi:thioredoxin domain-containing protein [Amycolatopsis sp. AA4]|uniref:thioredoxin domain-containing protein n=1 Tax=Actinomycetes TaxID=1760 RepID=UPI0001B56B97|nr:MULTISPECIES: thioredoxin domain-containing protein [Actinomycetes]ATY14688.1 thioredoxin domain-containing protein [Amycolatopsis sp. AA4]EFL10820.1 transcriptional regulator [Streptomyces sp. AA4]